MGGGPEGRRGRKCRRWLGTEMVVVYVLMRKVRQQRHERLNNAFRARKDGEGKRASECSEAGEAKVKRQMGGERSTKSGNLLMTHEWLMPANSPRIPGNPGLLTEYTAHHRRTRRPAPQCRTVQLVGRGG